MDNENIQNNSNKGQADPANKVAFVLSGGGNRGALEVGVLLALLEHDIRPQILVGTSVGAINAAAIAINPTLQGARWLEKAWHQVIKKAVLPANYMAMALRVLTGASSLFTNRRLRDFLESLLPAKIRQFSDIKTAELYITAADLHTGELHVFGIDPSESVLDSIMASTAFPLVLSPWRYQGRQYVDGALVSDLPISVAVQMKATEIYAIDVGKRGGIKKSRLGLLHVIRQILDASAYQRFMEDMGCVSKLPRDRIHYIRVDGFDEVGVWDFGHTAEMIEKGHQTGVDYLRQLSSYTGSPDAKST
jgi:NTE family protein